jgi:hypothetical protein
MTPQYFVQVQVLDPSHVSKVAAALEVTGSSRSILIPSLEWRRSWKSYATL